MVDTDFILDVIHGFFSHSDKIFGWNKSTGETHELKGSVTPTACCHIISWKPLLQDLGCPVTVSERGMVLP